MHVEHRRAKKRRREKWVSKELVVGALKGWKMDGISLPKH
jgi:hypothetical protein